MRLHQKFQKILSPLLISVAIFTLLFVIYLRMYKTPALRYDDEIAWIGGGYFFDLLINFDFENELWSSHYSYDQPKFTYYYYAPLFYFDYLKIKNTIPDYDYAKYLIDHNFFWFGYTSYKYNDYKNNLDSFLDWKYIWTLTWEQTHEEQQKIITQMGPGIQKTIEMIYKARFLNVILLSSTGVLIFLLTKKISNTPVAIITAIFHGTNSLVLNYNLLAQGDGLFTFLFILSIYLLLVLIEMLYKTQKQFLIPLFLLSITLALLAQTKLNGIMMLFFSISSLIILAIYNYVSKNKKSNINFLFSGVFIIFVFMNLFILLDPYLYKDPYQNTLNLFKFRMNVSYTMGHEDNKSLILYKGSERFHAIYTNFFLHENFHCRYNDLYTNNYCYKNQKIFQGTKIVFFLLGLFYLIWKKSKYILYIFSLFIFLQFMISLYLILNWDRYFIPLVYFFTFFQVFGVYYFLKDLINYVRNYKTTFHSPFKI